METITLQQALDITQATLWDFKKEQPAMTYLYSSYELLNRFWENRMKLGGGKHVERYVTLHDEENAKHRANWEEDTHNVKNIDEKVVSRWVTASTNLSWNRVEASMNAGPAEIYDVIQNKYNNMLREFCDEIKQALMATPTNSSDKLNPIGLPGWFPMGTDDSTGGWTGYTANYGDTNAFNVGELACSSSVNARHASYYADHNGNIDFSLLVLLDRACRKVRFQGPTVPKALDGTKYMDNFSLYTNDNIIGTLNLMYAQGDDQVGRFINSHFGTPTFKGMEFRYDDLLDTADTNLYGTDPIYGINHNLFYPVVLQDWDFQIGDPRPRDQAHLQITVDVDLVYTYICGPRRYGGFLISQQ